MLTINRISDFGVVGPLKACRLSDVGVFGALNRVFCDRLFDTGVFEGLIGVRFHQNFRLSCACRLFCRYGKSAWHKKQEDRSSRPSCWVIYAITEYAVARGTLKFVARCSCAILQCAAGTSYRDSRKRCCAARPSSSHLNTPVSSRTCEKTMPTSS